MQNIPLYHDGCQCLSKPRPSNDDIDLDAGGLRSTVSG